MRTRRSTEQFSESTPVLIAADDPSAALWLNDMRLALNLLPIEQREALVVVGACGWTYEEAASHAGCPLGTLKTHVFRARRLLAAHMASGAVKRDDLPASQAMSAILQIDGPEDPSA